MIIATAKKYLKEIKTDSLYGPVHKKYSEFSMVPRSDYIDCLKLAHTLSAEILQVNGAIATQLDQQKLLTFVSKYYPEP